MTEKRMVIIDVAELAQIIKGAVSDVLGKFTPQREDKTEGGEWLTTSELENLLKIKRVAIWRKEKEGLLKPIKVGNKKLYNKAEITRLVEAGRLAKYVRQ